MRCFSDDLRNYRHGTLLNIELAILLRIEQGLFDDSGIVYFTLVGFSFPLLTIHIELLSPKTVKGREIGLFDAANRYACIELKGRFDRLAFIDLIAVDIYAYENIVSGNSSAVANRTPRRWRGGGAVTSLLGHPLSRNYFNGL